MGLETEEPVLNDLAGPQAHPRDEQFAAWVSPHLGALSAAATVQLGAADAADVVQETLVRAWRRWHTYDESRGTARGWLMGILTDQVRRYRSRHLSRWRRAQPSADSPAPPDPGRRLDIENAVRALPARQQQVIVLYYLADLGVDEVASILGIGVGSVKSHLSAARTRLREVLDER